MWPVDEKGHSSTFRELIVIYYVLACYAKELENKKIAARIVLLPDPNHIFKH